LAGSLKLVCKLKGAGAAALLEWRRNGRNGTGSNDQEGQQNWGIRRLPGSYFFHISCAQSGSQAGGDIRKASSAVDL